MPIKIPVDLTPEMRSTLQDISDKLDILLGAFNIDLKGRRVTNAGSAVDDGDYVTLADVKRLVAPEAAAPGGASVSRAQSFAASMAKISMRA